MKLVRVVAAVLNQTPLDWDGNRKNVESALSSAREAGVSVVCFPELCISGYGCEDAFHSPGVARAAMEELLAIVPQTEGMIVSLGLPVWHSGGLFNCACLVADGKLLGFVAKKNLAGDGIHYEPRWFKPWPEGVVAEVEIDGESYPIGDLVFDCGGLRIGFEICEDAWVGNRPGVELAKRSVDVIMNPSASHFAFYKQQVRQRFVIEGSRAFNVCYIYANLLGNESGRAIYDGDAMIASSGKMLSVGPRFSYRDQLITTATVDIDEPRMQRVRSGSFQPRIGDNQSDEVACEFEFPPLLPDAEDDSLAAWEQSASLKEEEFARAVALGLFDYMRKSRSRGYVISLSGGADSAACAVLSALSICFGAEELGLSALVGKLGHIPALGKVKSVDELIQRVLWTVYQPTKNSSTITRDAAAGLADAVSANHKVFDIDGIVDRYVEIVEQGIGREITWETDDVPLQNIQARVRAPGVWMLANLTGGLLLATSNRSEAAVGYTTMDGDTCGGISPIAGIDKAFLRKWLEWMETTGPSGQGPITALAAINNQQPTAELRPPSEQQTDEKDLMPYHVLDAIERSAIRDKLTPLECYQRLMAEGVYEPSDMLQWVTRFFRLWSRNQWKRERFAPSFHLDDENLDPKTWCRFPILSGGFEKELRELASWFEGEKK